VAKPIKKGTAFLKVSGGSVYEQKGTEQGTKQGWKQKGFKNREVFPQSFSVAQGTGKGSKP
jgi:hypothetical protein